MRALVLAVLASSGALSQPVVTSLAVGPAVPGAEPLAVRVVVAGADEWEAPPALYWGGVGLDAVVLAGGTYVLVQGLRLLDIADEEGAGAGGFVVAMFGGIFAGVGVTAMGISGYDLVRVLAGDDPALARLFDPTRPVPGPPLPPYPSPRPPTHPDY